MRISIKTRIVLAIGIPLAAMWAGMVVYEYGVGRREAVAGVKAYLTELTARQAAQLDIELSKAEQLTDTLAALVALNPDLSRDQIEPWLAKLLRDNSEAFAIGVAVEPDVLAADGAKTTLYGHQCSESGVRFAALDDGDEAHSFHEWFRRQSVEGRPFWTEPYTDDLAGGRLMCTYVAPLLADGKFRGAVAVDVLTEHLLDDILATKSQGEYCTLISRKGVFLVHPDASRVMRPAAFKPLDEHGLLASADSSGASGVQPAGIRRVLDDRSGDPAWIVRVPIPSADWTLAAVLPESEVLAPIHARLARSLWVLAACGVLMLGVVWCVSARVTRPIRRLTRAAESLAAGDLETHVADASNSDEIGQLARTFNVMVGDLKAHIEHRVRDEAAKRQMEGELRAARRIQAALLPDALPDRPDRPFTLRAVNEPAKRVAGDFFDFFMVDRRTLAVVMADVSGKGIPAAIYMAVTRTTLRLFASPDK
ncbi:MAG: HAMP domain-containing protein, partial [Pirellulaceae bacterium]|nr:HAMP domain-containing protein [Pirellulaceae bacterium]